MNAKAALLGLLLICVAGLAGAQQSVGPESGLRLPRFVSIKTAEANLRRGPSGDYRVDWTYTRPGLPMMVTAEYDNWRRVRDHEGIVGWMHVSQLSGADMALITQHLLAIRQQPDDTSAEVALLEAGVIAELEDCAQDWCRLSIDGYKGWAPASGLWGVPGTPLPEDVAANQ